MTRNGTIGYGNQTDDPDNTSDVENQIVYTYNNLSQVTKSEQLHSGVVGGSAPSVQITFLQRQSGSAVPDEPSCVL
ncbi:MAG: hypothetical protein KDA93_17780 [Planctomycetaceae bacterium]|nr:hypothetical protein [Planctomycetaceae bacterium]